MTIANLTIGMHGPVCAAYGRGAKTVYVYAQPNWPAPAGQPEPCIPGDIVLAIQQQYGEATVIDNVALPAVGYRGEYNCDGLSVEAYYTPFQALAVPYTQYSITGAIVPYWSEAPVRQFARKAGVGVTVTPVVYPTAAGADSYLRAIPKFATEFRALGSLAGIITMMELAVGADRWANFYDLDEVRDWVPLSPLAYYWAVSATAGSAVVGGLSAASDATIQFR